MKASKEGKTIKGGMVELIKTVRKKNKGKYIENHAIVET